MYFFHKFVLEDIALETAVYVFIPFAVFFLFSLFMVYLEKPVIKKVSKEEYQKKRRIRSAVEGSAGAVSRQEKKHGHYEEDNYVPRGNYRPGPESAISDAPRQGVVNQAAFSRAKIQAAVENTQHSERLAAYPRQSSQPQRQRPVGRVPADGGEYHPRQPQSRAQQQAMQPRPAGNRVPAPHQTVARPAVGQDVEPSKNGYPPRRPQGQAAAPRKDIE